jgi:glycosyltransferase involved in cell wall biosynthesis
LDRRLRIALNAELSPHKSYGGIAQALTGLVAALGTLDDGPEEYLIIGTHQGMEWLTPHLGPNQSIVWPAPKVEQVESKPRWLRYLKRLLRPLRPLVGAIGREALPSPPSRQWPEVPLSDGFYESLGCEVVHFPFQHFVLCALPTIYNPHDLQHLHFPQFFTPSTMAWRETIYPAGCRLSHTVVTGSQWVKDDVVRHYGVDTDKVQVIPWAPPTHVFPAPSPRALADVKSKYRLIQPFAFYPAMIWAHKNHLRLLEALASLRDREGLAVRLVCTGHQHPSYWPRIEERLRSTNLNDQVQFLGMVPPEELRAIYRLSRFVVVPSLFEAASGPVFEAWQEGVPVACSTVTSLPEQVGDAALLFDPFSVEAIADAVHRMATDEDLRAELAGKGARRLGDFSWERTAKAYRAVYRRAACRPLTDEDRWLLSWDWMRDPRRHEEGTQ